MPEQYHQQGYHASYRWLLAVVASIVVIGIIVGGYFTYNYWLTTQQELLDREQAARDALIADIADDPAPAPVATSTPEVSTTTDPLLTATTTATTTLPNTALVRPLISTDSDSDGLTDIEESLIGSSASRPDSDGDGYMDGSEISNRYNPVLTGGGEAERIYRASYMTTATSSFASANVSLLIPRAWSVSMAAAARQMIITTDTGEIMKVVIRDNPQRLSAANWYLSQNPSVVASQLTPISIGALVGVVAPNDLAVYVTPNDRSVLYSIEYVMDPNTPFRYPSLFMLSVKSLLPVAVVSTTTTSPVATSTASSTVGQ